MNGRTMDRNSLISRFLKGLADDSGVTAIEYGLIAGTIGLVTALAFAQIGAILETNYYQILGSFF